MKATSEIKQHPLINEKGQRVNFLLEEWGEMNDFSYDYLNAHRHNFYEIMFFEKGSAKHDIDFQSYKAKSGSLHFVAPDNVHPVYRGKGSNGCSLKFTNGYISNEIIQQLPFNSVHPIIRLCPAELKIVQFLIRQIRQEGKRTNSPDVQLIRSYFDSFLLILNRNNSYKEEHQQRDLPQHVVAFKKMAQEHFRKHHSLKFYTSQLNSSSKYLIELSKEHNGKTPLKIIQENLISEAKRQLFHTQKSVKEITYSLRFDDPAHFSKYFKSGSSYSPSAYRKDAGK
jgi:AraC family transcriptional activator of pobA